MKSEFDFSGTIKFIEDWHKAVDGFDEFLKLFLLEMAERIITKTKERQAQIQAGRGDAYRGVGALLNAWGIGSVRFEQLAGGSRGWTREEWESRGRPEITATPISAEQAIEQKQTMLVVEIFNLMEYSSHVEFGHQTRGGAGWVNGWFMLTISIDEIMRQIPARYNKAFLEFMKSKGVG
ncbi:MAG: hypothetical protein LBC86_11130 [Oscillospiraceae bacterium]|jgi:hypothetical protein|nr:hypothetical protein [Oscillospiraceae bacterium]